MYNVNVLSSLNSIQVIQRVNGFHLKRYFSGINATYVVPENDLLPEEHIEGSDSDKIDEV